MLITNPRDIPGFVRERLAKHRFTAITGVNTLFNALLHNAEFAEASIFAAGSARRRHGGAAGGGWKMGRR